MLPSVNDIADVPKLDPVPLLSFRVVAPADPITQLVVPVPAVNVAEVAVTSFVVVQAPPMIGLFIQKSITKLCAAVVAGVKVTR